MFKELLPIGSVVLLKGGIKKIMVTGIKPVSKDDDGTEQEYDYIGVIYPEPHWIAVTARRLFCLSSQEATRVRQLMHTA